MVLLIFFLISIQETSILPVIQHKNLETILSFLFLSYIRSNQSSYPVNSPSEIFSEHGPFSLPRHYHPGPSQHYLSLLSYIILISIISHFLSGLPASPLSFTSYSALSSQSNFFLNLQVESCDSFALNSPVVSYFTQRKLQVSSNA